MSIAILGAGKLATAAALLLSHSGDLVVWARRKEAAEKIVVALPQGRVAASIEDACRTASLVVFAIPTHALREVARAAGNVARGDQMALHACRGLEGQGQFPHHLSHQLPHQLPHQILRDETCIKKIGALGGPLYLDDAVSGRPLVGVLASRFDEVQLAVKAIAPHQVRLHATRDIIGVEVAGAVSNVAQIAVGLAAGAGLSDTDQGILLTRGLVEASRVGQALGAERATFGGLAGVGDLIPRPITSTRKHRQLGQQIGEGANVWVALAAAHDLEGPTTARAVVAFARSAGLSVPLIEAVHAVLEGTSTMHAALDRVLSLDLELDVAA